MLISLIVSSILNTAHAVPLQLTQQGRVLDSNGAAITGTQDLTFRIFDAATNGTVYWSETVTVNFTNGYYAAVIGTDEVNNPLDSSTLALYPLYLEVQLNSNNPMMTRTAINSAPYAQMAGNAEVAESVDGGVVDASEVQINSSQVIDGSGNWVGQPMTVDWNNIDQTTIPSYITDGDDNTQLSETQVEGFITNGSINLAANSQVSGSDIVTATTFNANLPTDLADGDDDTLATLSCSNGEIAGWTGAAWSCVSDNTIDSTELATMLSNNAVDLNAASTIGGQSILTSDNDTLASLNCVDGEFARWDALISQWYCDSDSLEQLNCSDGEVVTYDSSSGGWVCASVLTLLDADGDGAVSWEDCDDSDPNSNNSSNDADCDGTVTNDDCDDTDPNSTTVSTDADCDDVLTADDCDDNDASSTVVSTDGDCDGILATVDCDDTNSSVTTTLLTDADCDGVLTADDCDDNDPTVTLGTNGSSSNCAAQSCNAILTADPTALDGAYYIDPDGLGVIEVYCDMALDDGGWTLVYINDPSNALATQDIGQLGSISGLSSPTSGSSTKLSDAYINAIRENSDGRVGYRVTSNDISQRYFSPSNCTYDHTSNNSTVCRQYISTYSSSTSPSYTQCVNWGGGSGGLDAWYGCNTSYTYSNVFNTHRTYTETAGITTNTGGTGNGSSGTSHGNDVLMWVR
jgi:hypothetical protein